MTERLKITRGSGNVFLDLGFDKDEAENLKLPSELMMRIDHRIYGLIRLREFEPLSGIDPVSRANQAAAFDKISRSTLTCRFSRRRRFSSSRSMLVTPSWRRPLSRSAWADHIFSGNSDHLGDPAEAPGRTPARDATGGGKDDRHAQATRDPSAAPNRAHARGGGQARRRLGRERAARRGWAGRDNAGCGRGAAAARVGRPSKVGAMREFLVAEIAKQPGVLSVELLRRARLARYAGGKSALYEAIAAIRARAAITPAACCKVVAQRG